jgi:uncharacterized protein (DUF2164 family)
VSPEDKTRPRRVRPSNAIGSALLDFFVRELGPAVYNQGVRDAARFLQEKLSDINGEIYEREAPE